MENLETRSFEVRSVDTEERTIEGIAVPYGQDTNVGGYVERIEKGAFGKITDVKLFAQHADPIGLVTEARETDEGLVIRARISKTARGEEIYTLLRDGVLNKFSVGFIPVENRMEGETVIRTKAILKEVSVVAFPAYDGADVTHVRQEAEVTASDNTFIEEKTNMSEDTLAPEVAELREAVTDLERKFAVMGDTNSGSSLPVYRSYGDYVKAYATGDEKAQTLMRAFTDTSDSVIKDAWVSDVLRFVDHGRASLSAFSKRALPASGNNIEYAKINTNTVATGAQAVQGDNLTYGEITLTTATAAVATYGGYVSMSRQAIERSSVNYLDAAFRAMALGYSKATNTAFVAAVAAAAGKNAADATTGGTVSTANLIAAVTEASVEIWNDTALTAEFILVSKDVFQVLVTKVDGSGRPLVAFANPQNNVGTANVPGIQASFMGLPVIVDPSLSTGTMYVANSQAVATYESAGAPLRLSDSNVVNLTNDFSVYGYAAFAVEQPKAICVVDVTV